MKQRIRSLGRLHLLIAGKAVVQMDAVPDRKRRNVRNIDVGQDRICFGNLISLVISLSAIGAPNHGKDPTDSARARRSRHGWQKLTPSDQRGQKAAPGSREDGTKINFNIQQKENTPASFGDRHRITYNQVTGKQPLVDVKLESVLRYFVPSC